MDFTLRIVMTGAALLGLISGSLGTLAVLRRQGLIGDAVAHAALPGIVLAFLVSGSKAPAILQFGAAITGTLSLLWVQAVLRTTRVRFDAALGMALAVFFGAGVVLLSAAQHTAGAAQAGLDRFLFGQAATLLREDLLVMSVAGILAFALVLAFWKEIQLVLFDETYAAALGLPVRRLQTLLIVLLVVAIVIGLQTVGVVLMSAVIVAPAAAARQWSNRFSRVLLLAGLFGLLSGVLGAWLSSLAPRLPTGPIIVLLLTGIALLSVLFAPAHGLFWQLYRRRRARQTARQAVLTVLHKLAQHHVPPTPPHSTATIQAALDTDVPVEAILRDLERRGQVRYIPGQGWQLSDDTSHMS
ncbi:metal ABC transporter permease [Rhodothermus profundi]|uniref:Manganese/zinc/iron transport system permease protein n=1 Tax=Rhodothermus profundi TaxID=633813 RepID=A0A1M6SGD8_9BACT|nr:iron chelate uptake ABC transporter family permease subunit [Rhodothermus profundi]SHK43746.1 manganese/zinc/iron transport system permease protein [Rhodothermus profundi]